MCYFFYKKKVQKSQVLLIISIVFMVLLSANYSLLLGHADESDIMIPLRNILFVFIFTYSVYYSLDKRILSFQDIFIPVVYGSLIYSLLKFLLFCGIVSQQLDAKQMLSYLEEIMPGIVSQIFVGNLGLYRLAAASDIIVAYVLVFFMLDKQLAPLFSKKFIYMFYFTALFVILQSYTRYLWALIIFVIMYKYIIFFKLSRFVIHFCIAIASLLFVFFIFPDIASGVFDVMQKRFGDTHSLDTKYIQTTMLLADFSNYPLFGKGAAAYVPDLVRSNEQKFQYENQWASFLLQFGILGVVLLLSLLFIILFPYIKKATLSSFMLASTFFIFVLSGITNPNLTILALAIIYILFIGYPFNKTNQLEVNQ